MDKYSRFVYNMMHCKKTTKKFFFGVWESDEV